jgi:hypothetical protein
LANRHRLSVRPDRYSQSRYTTALQNYRDALAEYREIIVIAVQKGRQ